MWTCVPAIKKKGPHNNDNNVMKIVRPALVQNKPIIKLWPFRVLALIPNGQGHPNEYHVTGGGRQPRSDCEPNNWKIIGNQIKYNVFLDILIFVVQKRQESKCFFNVFCFWMSKNIKKSMLFLLFLLSEFEKH